jgi:hypothetical protein
MFCMDRIPYNSEFLMTCITGWGFWIECHVYLWMKMGFLYFRLLAYSFVCIFVSPSYFGTHCLIFCKLHFGSFKQVAHPTTFFLVLHPNSRFFLLTCFYWIPPFIWFHIFLKDWFSLSLSVSLGLFSFYALSFNFSRVHRSHSPFTPFTIHHFCHSSFDMLRCL